VAGWPNSTVSLCSWHIAKDVRERLESTKGENVHGRTTHTGTVFENNAELGFIEIGWLEQYRERRKEIVRKRIQEAETRGETLPVKQRGGEEETVLNKKAIAPILSTMRKHEHWHPFKFPSTMPLLDNGSPVTPRFIWLRQATEMHALCKRYKEGYAWEYLWLNWYRFDKWQLWVRAATLEYYPIIQTNAPVETHWNHLKNDVLLYLTHPRLDRLCFEIHTTLMPLSIHKIRQLRKGVKGSSWHHSMVTEWRKLENLIEVQDTEDLTEAENRSIDLDAHNSPATQRRMRMETDHLTNVNNWSCQCSGYNHSAYYIWSHLLRLYDRPYPLKGEALRQHRPPLLFIETYHDPSQKIINYPSAKEPDTHPPASIEELGLSQQDLENLTSQFAGVEDNDEDYSRIEEEVRAYEDLLLEHERAINYGLAELRASRERFRRLPSKTARGMGSLVKLAANAHKLDHGRRRLPTWSKERAGGNMYRD